MNRAFKYNPDDFRVEILKLNDYYMRMIKINANGNLCEVIKNGGSTIEETALVNTARGASMFHSTKNGFVVQFISDNMKNQSLMQLNSIISSDLSCSQYYQIGCNQNSDSIVEESVQ